MKTIKNLLSWGVTPPTPTAKPVRRNQFRPVLMEFENVSALATVRRLVDLDLTRQMAFTEGRKQGEPLPYELLVINLILPEEPAQVVISHLQHTMLKHYLRHRVLDIFQKQRSPFFDVCVEQLYADLLIVANCVEDYVSTTPFPQWPTCFATLPSYYGGVQSLFSWLLSSLSGQPAQMIGSEVQEPC